MAETRKIAAILVSDIVGYSRLAGERNAGLPPERRIEFRVGIHLGDVVEEADGEAMASISPRASKGSPIPAQSASPRTPTAR
jgi:class 3 adenylate cyclase